ncbi:hypothetical protein ACTI_15610 [Actinoplanes sp. OR16]|uniref:hypothetical protein n=1 Tax=Actinoplanes sp. OR16 TaxID=946334 RepID=UPI000F6E63F6|nr:hypothetical protein [Actinoplanes sp. OR16]BBH64876.1 hypothetical protein ACTI_15610 [Actinoplanes sp. OR16]
MRRVRKALLAAALVLTTTGCGAAETAARPERAGVLGGWQTAGCAFARTAKYTVRGHVRTPVTPPALATAMERIDRGGRDQHADRYSGIEVDQKRVRAVVYRVPSARFDDFVRSSAEDACILVRDSAHALAELDDWHDRIVADLHYWGDQGVRIVTVGSRHDGVGVEIGTRDLDEARLMLPARYGIGAPLVFVEEGPVTPVSSGRKVVPESGG